MNCNKIQEMIQNFKSSLFEYAPKNFQFYSNCILVKLLDFSFEHTKSDIYKRLTHYFTTPDNSGILSQINELLTEMDRCRNSKLKASIQNKICKILTNIYRKVFVNDLKPYFIVIEWDNSIKTVLKAYFEESEQKYQNNEAQ
eukprot:89144_1